MDMATDDLALPDTAFQSTVRAAESVGAADLALINALSRAPVAAESVFAFDCVPSTDRLDSYFTRQAPSSLANYARDASAGVAVMNSHRTGGPNGGSPELPLGRTFHGEVRQGDEGSQLYARAYLLRDYQPNPGGSPNTDTLIRGIESGVLSDLSIGFRVGNGAWYRCSVCNQDMLRSPACTHYPGYSYEGNRAYAWVENARLAEVSFVYKGATPGAAILKAQRAAAAGALDRKTAGELEDLYQVRLINRYAVPDLGAQAQQGGGPVKGSDLVSLILTADEQRAGARLSAATRESLDAIRQTCLSGHDNHDQAATALAALLAEAEPAAASQAPAESEAENARLAEASRLLGERDSQLARLAQQVAELTLLAELGRQYRGHLVDEAIIEGVRAFGNGFNADLHRDLLGRATIEQVGQFRANWEALARERLGPGGRQTTAPPIADAPATPKRPTAQYRG